MTFADKSRVGWSHRRTRVTSATLLVAGIAFGVIAALAGQINLLAPWLVLANVAFVGAMAIGFLITDPWVGRLETAAQASPVDAPSDELTAVVGDPIARVGTARRSTTANIAGPSGKRSLIAQ